MNPIKGEELYQDDGTIRKLIAELKELQSSYKEMVDSIRSEAGKVKKALEDQAKAGTANKKTQDEAARQADALARQQQKYQSSLTDTGKEIIRLRSLQTKKNQLTKAEIRLANSAEGSYDRLSAQYSINKIRLNAMSAEQRKATKAGLELERQTKEIYEEMKALQEATGKTSLNVGNYKESIKEAVSEMGAFPGTAGQVAGGVEQISQSFRAIVKSPILLFLAGVVGALSALYNGFRQSASGSRVLAQAGARLRGTFSVLRSEAGQLAESLIEAFKDPRQAVEDLGKSIAGRLNNSISGFISLAKSSGDFVGRKLTGDLDGARNAANNLSDALAQTFTGLDKEQRKEAQQSLEQLQDRITRTANAFATLEKRQFAVSQSNRDLAISAEAAATKEARLQILADDATRSFQEREKAAAEARSATENRAAAELRIARNNLALLNEELDIRQSLGENVQELLDGQLSAYREVAAAERDLITAQLDNEKTRRELVQDRLERDLDILIDGFDNQKTINEQRIRDERLTLEERRAILEETQRLSDDSFRQQIATIQEFTGVTVDANALIAESNAVLLNQRIRALGLSEIIEGRLLEIVRDRRTANQDLATSEFELAQAEARAVELAANTKIKAAEDAKRSALDQLEIRQELAKSEFEVVERSATEKKKFELEQEAKKLQAILDINKQFQQDLANLTAEGIDVSNIEVLNDDEIQTVVNQIAGVRRQIEEAAKEENKDVFDLLGFDVSDEKKEAIGSAFNFAKQQVLELARLRTQLADQRLDEANQDVSSAEAALQAELTRNEQGLASNIETRRRDLENAQEVQAKAREEQRRAQRAEQRLQTIQQASNLVTASAKIWGQLGFPAAIPAIALMFGSFIATKARAARLARQENRRGTFQFLRGGSAHGTGRDISLGLDGKGVEQVAERGESFAVFNAPSTRKYRDVLPSLFEAISNGELNKWVESQGRRGEGAKLESFPNFPDNSAMEGGINRIATNTSKRVYQDAEGNTVIEQGYNRTIIRRA